MNFVLASMLTIGSWLILDSLGIPGNVEFQFGIGVCAAVIVLLSQGRA